MEDKKLWYVVNAYSGHEQKVKDYLESRRESMGMENNIFRVVIPQRTEVEVKDGVKKEKVRKMFPGYVLIEMIMSDEAWYVVRNTPGVTGLKVQNLFLCLLRKLKNLLGMEYLKRNQLILMLLLEILYLS